MPSDVESPRDPPHCLYSTDKEIRLGNKNYYRSRLHRLNPEGSVLPPFPITDDVSLPVGFILVPAAHWWLG